MMRYHQTPVKIATVKMSKKIESHGQRHHRLAKDWT